MVTYAILYRLPDSVWEETIQRQISGGRACEYSAGLAFLEVGFHKYGFILSLGIHNMKSE